MAPDTIRQFREWFWRPPRAHGQVVHDRSVSFLELLYDLVYVAVISQAEGLTAGLRPGERSPRGGRFGPDQCSALGGR